jgi:hypothetical protein
MLVTPARRFILLGIVALALAAALIAGALVAAQLLSPNPTLGYPGATLTAEHQLRQVWPTFFQRRDTA